jgi:heme oxygenase
MTNILRRILPNQEAINKMHVAIEGMPFLQRYSGNTPDPLTLVDHYQHLVQLKVLYATFSTLLSSANFKPVFPEHLQSLLQRDKNIEADLQFLDPHVLAKDKGKVNTATQHYVQLLKQLPNEELLIHFLVSLLGDLNGGQFLKVIVRDLYLKHQLIADKHAQEGTHFYVFNKHIGSDLTAWLQTFIPFNHDESLNYGDDNHAKLRGKAAMHAFRMQTAIVEELELTRCGSNFHFARFFACPSPQTVALVGAGTAMVVGAVVGLCV